MQDVFSQDSPMCSIIVNLSLSEKHSDEKLDGVKSLQLNHKFT